MKKIFLLIALALLTISTATALDPIKVAIVNNGGAAVNVQVNLTNYTGGTATNVFTSTTQSLTPNGSGIIMVDISDATYASGTTWSAITPASVNSYYVIDVNVGGNLYAQYRLDQQIISQAQTGVLDNDGNFTPAVNGDGSLGSDDLRWGELFIEGSTLHVGPGGGMAGNDELAFSYDDGTNTATMTVANKIAMTSVEDAVSITQQATIDGISIGQGGGDQITNTAVGKYALSNNTTSGNENTAIGFTALLANTTGDWNTATGYSALSANTTGNQNTAIGYASLRKNSTGNGNIATGVFTLQNNTSGGSNTATGNAALQLNTLGSLNTATGSGALNDNISGNWNTATGASALNKNTGSNNTATGSLALNSNTTGENNTAVGYSSGRILETGSFNVFLGRDAGNNASQKVNAANSMALGANTFTTADNQVVIGDANITETNLQGVLNVPMHAVIDGITIGQGGGNVASNTVVGVNALTSNTTGANNTANGQNALFSNTTGDNNTANGVNALYSNTTGAYNTANGINALTSNTTGANNTANGQGALSQNTTGSFNTANGNYALNSNITGYNNTANGLNALRFNTTGIYNTANGSGTLYLNTTGTENTANGGSALQTNTTGSLNTANGANALISNTTGSNNTAVGYSSGRRLETGSLNVFLGNESGDNASQKVDAANSMALGANTYTTADNQVVIGDANITETQLRGVTLMDLTSPGTQNARITSTGKIEASSTVSVHFSASAPTSPVTGSLWYEIGVGLNIWDGGAWVAI